MADNRQAQVKYRAKFQKGTNQLYFAPYYYFKTSESSHEPHVIEDEFNSIRDDKLDTDGDGKDVSVTFADASSRVNISSAESLATMFGKIKKWLGDLKVLAFKDAVSDSDISGTISDSHIASASTWNNKVSRKAYQSSDFSDWNEFETTGVYEICGQVSGVQNSPESGRMTLYVTKSTTASTGRFFVTQLAVGNHVYRRTKSYKRTEGSVDIYEWSSWSIIDGDVTYTLSGSSDVGFNEMKDVFAKTGNIAVLVGEAIGNYTYLERFPLTDVEYSNGSISEFVFSRSRPHDDGTPSTAGTVYYYKLSSSGWMSGSYTVGYARKAGSLNMSASEGSDVRPVYFTAGGAPSVCGARFPYLVDSSGNYSSTQIKMYVGNTLGTDSNTLYFV